MEAWKAGDGRWKDRRKWRKARAARARRRSGGTGAQAGAGTGVGNGAGRDPELARRRPRIARRIGRERERRVELCRARCGCRRGGVHVFSGNGLLSVNAMLDELAKLF